MARQLTAATHVDSQNTPRQTEGHKSRDVRSVPPKGTGVWGGSRGVGVCAPKGHRGVGWGAGEWGSVPPKGTGVCGGSKGMGVKGRELQRERLAQRGQTTGETEAASPSVGGAGRRSEWLRV